MKLVETASKWGNGYNCRYYLNGRRITNTEAHRLFNDLPFQQVNSERLVAGWRSTWELPNDTNTH